MAKKKKVNKPGIDGGFVVIPKRTLKTQEWHQLPVAAKICWMHLLTEFYRNKLENPENKVRMTLSQIQQYSGLSRPTVARGLKALKQSDFMEVSIQGGLEGNPSEYKLNGRYLF